ncbi:MAG: ribosome hibernation-promoting factor, HPF/YfiA family [Myxococcota bacterium]
MQIDVTFRRMDSSEAIKNYLNDKMGKMKKFLSNPCHAHVVLTSERFRNKADVTLNLKNGLMIKGVDSSEDLYYSIDQAMVRIEKQLKKYKEKIRSHKPSESPAKRFKSHVIEQYNLAEEFEIKRYKNVMNDIPETDNEFGEDMEVEPAVNDTQSENSENNEELQHEVVRTNEYIAEPLALEDAIMKLELQDKKFLVFTNAKTDAINVLYYREDGEYGLIETDK